MIKFILCFVLYSAAALAADSPREIDFTQVLKGVTGQPLMQAGADGKTLEPQTLGDVAGIALESNLPDEHVDGAVKLKRDQLARRIYGNTHAALTAEELALIIERIGKTMATPQVGAAWPLLDPTLGK